MLPLSTQEYKNEYVCILMMMMMMMTTMMMMMTTMMALSTELSDDLHSHLIQLLLYSLYVTC